MNTHIIKVGVVGLDGHGPVFTGVVNGPSSQMKDMRVVAAMPVASVMISKEQLDENIAKTEKFGVKIIEDPEEMAAKVDGILISHDDGSKHYNLVKLFVDKGKPLFVDKPLEASMRKARQLVELCRTHKCPVFSASSLRFSLEMQKILADQTGGRILSSMTYSPYAVKPTMPGWFYYGIHAVEPLYQLMGVGCQEVRCFSSEQGPVAVGIWEGKRLGIARAISTGYHGYGFTVWRKKVTETEIVNADFIYSELLKNIKKFFETGIAPVTPEESVEVIAFIEAANESMANGGKPIQISSVLS